MTDTYGLKIIDTTVSPRPSLTSTNPYDYIFNSIWNTVKVYKHQMSSVTIAGSGSGYIEIAHGLSFIPASIIYTEADSGNTGRFYFGNYVYGVTAYVFDSYCNSTYLHISLINQSTSSKTFRVYSFIFADNGQ